jgi:hypothetical protein
MTTNFDICQDALRKIGVIAQDQAATANEMETARKALGRMLWSWQNRGYMLFSVASTSVAMSTSASYALVPRPLAVQSVRFKRSTVELPMTQLTREEYDTLPVKTTTGTPTTWYYDRQVNSGTIYVWPLLATATSETLEITYVRSLDDPELTADADFPVEWEDAVVYGLASRLSDDFMVNVPNVIARAERELSQALAGDREESIYFVGEP